MHGFSCRARPCFFQFYRLSIPFLRQSNPPKPVDKSSFTMRFGFSATIAIVLTALTSVSGAPTPTSEGLSPRSYVSGGVTCYCELGEFLLCHQRRGLSVCLQPSVDALAKITSGSDLKLISTCLLTPLSCSTSRPRSLSGSPLHAFASKHCS